MGQLPKVVDDFFSTPNKTTIMRTIQEIEPPLIEVSKPKELSHGMKVYRVPSDGPFCFKLNGVTIPFAPSCFQGTGEEERQGLVLSVYDEVYKQMHAFSESFKAQLSETHPDIEGKWNSSLKAATDKYPANLRVKINVKGDKAFPFYDMAGESTKAPAHWPRLEVNVVVRLGGVYVQPRGAGMLLDVIHLQYDPEQNVTQNPFA